jgi:hypothetical protein
VSAVAYLDQRVDDVAQLVDLLSNCLRLGDRGPRHQFPQRYPASPKHLLDAKERELLHRLIHLALAVRACGRYAELSMNIAEWLAADGATEVFGGPTAGSIRVALVTDNNVAARWAEVRVNISEGRAGG